MILATMRMAWKRISAEKYVDTGFLEIDTILDGNAMVTDYRVISSNQHE